MLASWKESCHKPRQHIKEQRHHFANRGPYNQCYVFSFFPLVMYECESWIPKESWVLKNWCFQIMVLEKTLEIPLDSKEVKPVNSKQNQPWIFIGRTEAEVQYFGHLMQRADSLEKTLMLGKTEGKRRKVWQRMRWLDSTANSVHMSLSKFWEIVKDRGACCNPWGHKEWDML